MATRDAKHGKENAGYEARCNAFHGMEDAGLDWMLRAGEDARVRCKESSILDQILDRRLNMNIRLARTLDIGFCG